MQKKPGDKDIYARLFPVKNRKGDQTKVRIVQAAIDSIAGEGVENMTFDSVGKRIGINAAQVRYHFTEKADLIDRCVHYVLITLQEFTLAELEKVDHWHAQVMVILNGTFDWALKHPEQGPTLLLFDYSSGVTQRHRTMHTQMFESGSRRITTILEPAKKAKGWTSAEVKEIGLSVWAAIDGYLLYLLTTNVDKSQLRKLALKAINRLLDE